MLRLLSDSRVHTVPGLCVALRVSPDRIGDLVSTANNELGIPIQRLSDARLRLREAIEWLEERAIRDGLSSLAAREISKICVFHEVGSTNDVAMEAARAGAPSAMVFLAERQRNGHGRRGRNWVSPFACNLYLSIYFRIRSSLEEMGGLSLCAGVAVAHAIQSLGCEKVALKWPNDLVWDGRKFGGILIDLSGRDRRASWAVVGVGINLVGKALGKSGLTQPWTSLQDLMVGTRVSRNALTSAVINSLVLAINEFGRYGFEFFSEQWERLDSCCGHLVTLQTPKEDVRGYCRGVSSTGALLLERNGRIESFFGGEISLRGDR